MKKVLFEGILVAVTGCTLAFAANALSPRGLKLGRNYFPSATRVTSSTNTGAGNSTNQPAVSNSQGGVLSKLIENGLQAVEGDEALKLFKDPGREQGQIVFIDARNDEHYTAGHIPGSYQFDHYRQENYIGTVAPVCLSAKQIIVYCAGGECEDSISAAIILRDTLHLPPEKLFVYEGGITEWTSKNWPVETGARK